MDFQVNSFFFGTILCGNVLISQTIVATLWLQQVFILQHSQYKNIFKKDFYLFGNLLNLILVQFQAMSKMQYCLFTLYGNKWTWANHIVFTH